METIEHTDLPEENQDERIQVGPGYRSGQVTVVMDSGERHRNSVIWICRCDCGAIVRYTTVQLRRNKDLACPDCVAARPGIQGENLAGRKFGALTALYNTGTRSEHNGMIWHCRCECGKELDVGRNLLVRGKRTSCGCRSRRAPKDLTGRHFGMLTALSLAPPLRGRRQWLCRCDCGKEKTVLQDKLLRGEVKSCGCQERFPVMDLEGARFGRLTVLSYVGSIQGKHSWKCRCDCGREVVARQSALVSGVRKSCGCMAHRPSLDLVGARFGRLTVVEDEGIQGKAHMWRCACDCGSGKEVHVTQDHLLQGLTKSCGCLHDTVGRENLRLVEGTSVTKLEKRRGKLSSSNTSGYTGVYQRSWQGQRRPCWVAQIGFKGKNYFLGSFPTKEQAIEARKKAEEQLYDGFLSWYYKEYLPGLEAEKTPPESAPGKEQDPDF